MRAARDFAGADAVRDRLRAGGWEVVDSSAGSRLERVPTASLVAIDAGWPADVARWRRSVSELDAEVLVAPLDRETGWAEAANGAVQPARAEVVILFDPSVEAAGDVSGPLLEALKDPSIAVAGPFGVRGKGSLKEFAAHPGPEVDAIEGYCMAFRRADFLAVGGFDRRFRFYRIADIELSFKLRAKGDRRAVVVPVPVIKHEHRMWEATADAERQRLSRKNLYRFLDLWRDREDLLVERGEQSGKTQRDQQQAGKSGDPGPDAQGDQPASAGDRPGQ